jgi:8-oxo-dGTP diphosphatase
VVETGERLTVAVRREVLEETGLSVEPVALVEVFERITSDGDGRVEYHYVLADYWCRVKGGALAAGDDASRVAWASRGEFSAYRITAGSVPVIEKALRMADEAVER